MRIRKFLALSLIFALAACGSPTAEHTQDPTPSSTSSPSVSDSPESSPTPSLSESASHSSSSPTQVTKTPSPTATKSRKSFSELGLTGTLFFHRYEMYGDWEATLFGMDLESGRLVDLSANWETVICPINAHPNPDGTALVFMGSTKGLAESEWDVFVTHWVDGQWQEPVNLTGPNDKRDEDPKFSPNGHTITYKENGVMATIEIDGTNKHLLTVGKADSSMPYFTADGNALLFERNQSIWKYDLTSGEEEILWLANGSHAYYPIGVDTQRFLFTEVQPSGHDRLVWGYYDGRAPHPLFFKSNRCDNSDPYPYETGQKFVFYVTGCVISYKGGYNLAVADLKNLQVYSLEDLNPDANSQWQELGPAWSATAKLPADR